MPASPDPTPAPLVARSHQPKRTKLQQDEVKRAVFEERDILLGPFEARAEGDVEALRREIGLDSGSIKRGYAADNAKAWLARHEREGGPKKMTKRQTTAEQRCFVGNSQLSCYPTAGIQVDQGTWSKFIWNTNYPLFTNNGGYVDVYLFRQDKDTVATSWTHLPNTQGQLSFSPNDAWWAGREVGDNFNGTNIAWPFYFVVTYAGQGLVGPTTRLSTWSAIQTALPSSIAASRSLASLASVASAASASRASESAATLTGDALSSALASYAAASSALKASLSSVLVASLTAQGFSSTQILKGTATATLGDGRIVTATATAQANGLPLMQDEGGSLPGYAIALIAVFGFFLLVGAIVGLYFLLAAARRRREREFDDENDSKLESRTPIMRDHHYSDDAPSSVEALGAPMQETTNEGESKSDAPFSSNQASLMADAFRAALRQPALDGEERSGEATDDSGGTNADHTKADELIREELKAEGHDLRSVEDRRQPEVHD